MSNAFAVIRQGDNTNTVPLIASTTSGTLVNDKLISATGLVFRHPDGHMVAKHYSGSGYGFGSNNGMLIANVTDGLSNFYRAVATSSGTVNTTQFYNTITTSSLPHTFPQKVQLNPYITSVSFSINTANTTFTTARVVLGSINGPTLTYLSVSMNNGYEMTMTTDQDIILFPRDVTMCGRNKQYIVLAKKIDANTVNSERLEPDGIHVAFEVVIRCTRPSITKQGVIQTIVTDYFLGKQGNE